MTVFAGILVLISKGPLINKVVLAFLQSATHRIAVISVDKNIVKVIYLRRVVKSRLIRLALPTILSKACRSVRCSGT